MKYSRSPLQEEVTIVWKFIINVSTHYNQICIWKQISHAE